MITCYRPLFHLSEIWRCAKQDIYYLLPTTLCLEKSNPPDIVQQKCQI